MNNILPFFVFALLCLPSLGKQVQSIRLKGRVPASVEVTQDTNATKQIFSNVEKNRYTVKKIKKKDIEVLEITFH